MPDLPGVKSAWSREGAWPARLARTYETQT